MSGSKVYHCMSCGAPLQTIMNKSFVFCQFCGCKNEISGQEMQTNINVGNINIKAKTDTESMLSSAEFAVSLGQYDKANEMLLAAIMSGVDDYRIYILKAKIDLLTDNNKSFFDTVRKLQHLEAVQSSNREVTIAICQLMQFRGMNGVIALHIATYHELMDMVIYFTEHGSDINCVAGMRKVTPISIMFVETSSSMSGLDGTPFVRNKQRVAEIRRYLMSKGARDIYRHGY